MDTGVNSGRLQPKCVPHLNDNDDDDDDDDVDAADNDVDRLVKPTLNSCRANLYISDNLLVCFFLLVTA